jgi:hypothetical protein
LELDLVCAIEKVDDRNATSLGVCDWECLSQCV